jgi:hypothetical protein
MGMGCCQEMGLPIPRWEEGCLWMQALKQWLVEESKGVSVVGVIEDLMQI